MQRMPVLVPPTQKAVREVPLFLARPCRGVQAAAEGRAMARRVQAPLAASSRKPVRALGPLLCAGLGLPMGMAIPGAGVQAGASLGTGTASG